MKTEKVVIIGAGVAGINAATKLLDNNYPGYLITIIDKGNDPYNRKPEEVMTGMLGAGGWSDGKLTYHTAIGGQLAKYCGEEKAMELMDEVIENFKRFHPKPWEIFCSDPTEEPEFIKPYFGLRLFPVWHIGSNYLHEIAKGWYQFLIDKGVRFYWETEVTSIDFNNKEIGCFEQIANKPEVKLKAIYLGSTLKYDKLIFAAGKSGIDFAQHLSEQYKFQTEAKSVQIGVRFEAPQKYFQKLIDISYDFKLYKKHDKVSLRSFCTNNNAAYVAVEETYGDISYNGHAKKGEEFENGMTNFGILMEIKGIDNPFEWCRDIVKKLQKDVKEQDINSLKILREYKAGMYYTPGNRLAGVTSEGDRIRTYQTTTLELFKTVFGEYADYILEFIDEMNKVFEFGDDWGIYMPEVKYLSPEPIVNHSNLALKDYPNVHFVGDALSARGITVSGAQGIYVAENILK